MLIIPCPWCGPRDETEFSYGGDATIRRPEDPAATSDETWADYLYVRENPRGAHREHWFHRFGCRRWLVLRRDTLTHAVAGAEAP